MGSRAASVRWNRLRRARFDKAAHRTYSDFVGAHTRVRVEPSRLLCLVSIPCLVVVASTLLGFAHRSVTRPADDMMRYRGEIALSVEARFAEYSRLSAVVRQAPELRPH